MTTRVSHRPLIFALLTVLFWVASFSGFAGRDHLHEFTFLALSALSGNEAILYVSVAFVQLFFVSGLGVWLAQRWGLRADRIARGLIGRRTAALAGMSALGAALALLVAITVVRQHTITEDEKTYLFQAKLLLMGKLSVPVPQGAGAFWEPFIVGTPGHWSGQYFWAQPALLGLGLVAHAVYLVPALEVACTVFFTGLLVDELTGDRRAAVLAAGLVATSPIVVMTGATLLNANLSAACGAISLWGLARLHRAPDRAATLALGLSTAVGLHNRVLDHAALLLAAACVLLVAHAGARLAIVRRLLPAVAIALPFLAAHLLTNKAVSGDWRHSGYWLHYQGHDWTAMGFGTGAGGFPQDGSTASAKTVANGMRMMFYTGGGPLLFAPLAACFVVGASRGLLRAGAWVVCVYYAAYFFYASASITTTGPVYFDALVPVLAGSAALATVKVHHAVSEREALRRIIPGLVLAQVVAAFLFFWPPALLEVRRSAKDSAACDDLASTLDPTQPALVFVTPAETYASWTFWEPMPSPTLDDRILFARTGGAAVDAPVAARFGAGHGIYLAHCVAAPEPKIERYDPLTGGVSPLESK